MEEGHEMDGWQHIKETLVDVIPLLWRCSNKIVQFDVLVTGHLHQLQLLHYQSEI